MISREELNREIGIHKDICAKIHQTFISKRQDYGNTTEESLKRYGPSAMLTRIYDKHERLNNLLLGNKMPNNESIQDTLLDMANYCIIWIMEMTKEYENAKVGD